MKRKRLLFVSIVIFMIVSFASSVKASSFNFIASAQKEIFKPGEEVLVSLKIDEINAGEHGINVVEMSLEYDESVFDNMEFEKKDGWDSTYNNIKNSDKFGKLLYTNISVGVTEAQSIGNIKFKLKDNLQDMETEIKLLSVTSNDGKELMPEGDRIIKIKIVNDKPEPEPEPELKPEPKPEEPTQEEGKVTVKYQDLEGNALKEDILLVGKVGENYKAERLDVTKYKLLEVVGNEEGKFTKEDKTVIYKYEKVEGKVIVEYIDRDGNIIQEETVITGKVDDPYKIERLEIEGYELINVIGNEEGVYKLEEQRVSFRYKKIEKQVVPQTGQSRIIYVILGIIIIASGATLSYLYINNKKDKENEK